MGREDTWATFGDSYVAKQGTGLEKAVACIPIQQEQVPTPQATVYAVFFPRTQVSAGAGPGCCSLHGHGQGNAELNSDTAGFVKLRSQQLILRYIRLWGWAVAMCWGLEHLAHVCSTS